MTPTHRTRAAVRIDDTHDLPAGTPVEAVEPFINGTIRFRVSGSNLTLIGSPAALEPIAPPPPQEPAP